MNAAAGLLLGAGVLLVALFVNRALWGFLPYDPPGGTRKRHAQPLPMVGVVLGGVATVMLAMDGTIWLALGAFLTTLCGWLDDRRKERGGELAVGTKAGLLLVAAALAIASLYGTALDWHMWLLATLLVFAITNALNFLDNTDGVAAAVGGLGLVLATEGHGTLAWIGYAFLAFLPFNWPRARALLGDAGALVLGYVLAITAFGRGLERDVVHWTALFAPVAIPLIDLVQVVCARLILGFAPWVGDRRHLTHIAMNTGVPQVLVAPLFAAAGAGLFAWLR